MTPNLSAEERFQKMRKGSKGSTRKRLLLFILLILLNAFVFACDVDERQSGVPAKAQQVIGSFTEDFNSGRYSKIYEEAAEEWRGRVTLEQSNQTFATLKERLGAIKPGDRTYISGRQQQNPGAGLPANSLVIRYNTKFKRADETESDGIETFTLIERDGRFQVAGYSVSSNLLNPQSDK